MTGDTPLPSQAESPCANCGTVFAGEFCPACGQSRKSIERSFLALAGEALGDILQWDGRFMTTYRQLFTRPGRIAREYADGKRQSYTPPVRLYLVISLIFFAVLTGSGIRIVAVELQYDPADDSVGTMVTMFQAPRSEAPATIPPDAQDALIEQARDREVPEIFQTIALRAMNAPDALEEQAAAAAGQAMILMVVLFALLNAIFHPKRRLIEHAIHALYFHATVLLPLATVLIIGIFTRMPLPIAVGIAVASALAFHAAIILFDRGFYASSWIGAILRSIPVILGYLVSAGLVSLGLIIIGAL